MNANLEGFPMINRIEDNKTEKIAFILDMNEEIFKEDFLGSE